jgi:DNA primase small subunit
MHAQLTREGQIPVKLDIGSFFECEPIKGRTNHPIAKELVVDIDINDYDMVRTCCQGKQCCSRCWKFLAAALTLLRTSFEEDFDFHNFMCVFSGRRGVHMWVCDRRAIMLQVPQRRSVISYLMLTTGNEHAQSYLCENTLREVRVDDRKRKDELKKHLL